MSASFLGAETLDHIELLNKLYDVVRAVQPEMKTEVKLNIQSVDKLTASCFDFWQRGEACENCVSMRAYRENQTVVKLEYNSKRLYMVTAVPVTYKDQRVIVEMLKDVTESGIIEDLENKDPQNIYEEIRLKNRLIVTDPLTQVYNRRFMDERLPFELLDSQLNNTPVSVAFADIDLFKSINDQFGHASGDLAMTTVAGILQREIRVNSDWIARQGGDEFCIFLKNTNLTQARVVLERMRKKVEETQILLPDGRSIAITVSFGLESFQHSTITMDELLERVDKKLYQAKQQGKNSVVWG